MSTKKTNTYILSSLDNGLKILDLLSVTDNIGVTEIGKLCKLSKTTTYNILTTLVRRNYVIKTTKLKYRLGSKLSASGEIVKERHNISEIVTPYLCELRDKLHETIAVNVLNVNGRTIILQREEGSSPEHVRDRVGYEVDAHTNASGKVLLAHMPTSMRNEMLKHLKLTAYTNNTITTIPELIEVLNQVKKQGYDADCDEHFIGYGSVAAPIFDETRNCVAALGIVCVSSTLNRNSETFLTEILSYANMISLRLGYRNS